MVLGLIAKWGSIAGGIVLFILFAVRASQVGLGNAASEVGSGVSNVGKGIGETGTGIAKFGQGIGAGITGLFSPLQFFKDLIFGGGGSTGGTTTNPTVAANSQQTVTTATQASTGGFTIASLNARAFLAGSSRQATSIVKSGGTTTSHFTGSTANRATATKGAINRSIKSFKRKNR